jgi:hypothetical protein
MANRSAASDFIIKNIEKLCPGSGNSQTYKDLFSKMSDKEFDAFMKDLESGEKFLPIIIPNFSETPLNLERNLALGDELGHDFFQKVWIEGEGDKPTYLTPVKFLVMDLPLRRASQMLTKKIRVPKHNKVIDSMTGQPTGESKGAKMSYPELQVCAAMGLEKSMVELMKFRGGDVRGHTAYNAMISKFGTANLKTLENYASGVESKATLRTFLISMHLKNSL